MLSLIPNALTLLRIALAAAFPFVPPAWRVAVLAAALATEFLDGALARAFGWTSRFGRVLDPVADRCVFIAVAATLVAGGDLTWRELLALGARDLLMAAVMPWIVAFGHAPLLARMRPRVAGKLTTALQYAALLWVLLEAALPVPLPVPLLWAVLAIGVFAAAQYFADFRRLRADLA